MDAQNLLRHTVQDLLLFSGRILHALSLICLLETREHKKIAPFLCVFRKHLFYIFLIWLNILRSPLWSSSQEFLATDPEVRVRFLALPDLLASSESGTGTTQPREYN
jgi:hypothetical protein